MARVAAAGITGITGIGRQTAVSLLRLAKVSMSIVDRSFGLSATKRGSSPEGSMLPGTVSYKNVKETSDL